MEVEKGLDYSFGENSLTVVSHAGEFKLKDYAYRVINSIGNSTIEDLGLDVIGITSQDLDKLAQYKELDYEDEKLFKEISWTHKLGYNGLMDGLVDKFTKANPTKTTRFVVDGGSLRIQEENLFWRLDRGSLISSIREGNEAILSALSGALEFAPKILEVISRLYPLFLETTQTVYGKEVGEEVRDYIECQNVKSPLEVLMMISAFSNLIKMDEEESTVVIDFDEFSKSIFRSEDIAKYWTEQTVLYILDGFKDLEGVLEATVSKNKKE